MSTATETHSDDDRRENEQRNGTKSPERLERDVDQARARLGRTASELSDRLSPGELMDQALGMAREHGGEFGRNLGSQVKNNPLPMILTSVGISWMMMTSGKSNVSHNPGSYDTSSGKDGHSFKNGLGDALSMSKDKASAMGDRVHDASANLKESAQSARESLVKFYRDQPLLAGSLGIAIGAALGALVPPTEMEDDMLGEARDNSVDAAKSQAARKYDEIRESARSD